MASEMELVGQLKERRTCAYEHLYKLYYPTIEKYILSMANVLAKGGRAFFLLRPLHQHGFDALAVVKNIVDGEKLTVKTMGKIRGTDVILIEK